MSGENRNSARVNNTRTNIRRCSFCRNPGHNIQTCDSMALLEFENISISNYMVFHSDVLFETWLKNYYYRYPIIVRAYAVRYCGALVRSQLVMLLYKIRIRISNMVYSGIHYNRSLALDENNSAYHEITTRQIRELLLLLSNNVNDIYERSIQDGVVNFNITTTVEKVDEKIEHDEWVECNICYDSYSNNDFVKLDCDHKFCKNCIKRTLQNEVRKMPSCAFCRSQIKNIKCASEIVKNELDECIAS